MRKYWTEERFSYDGEIFQLEDVWMTPKPVQPEGPPIWLAGRSKAAIARAARLGDGYMPYMYTPDRCRASFDEVQEKADQLGAPLRPGFTWSAFVYVSLDDSPERARENGIRDLSWRYGKDFSPWIDKYCVYGDAETCSQRLREFLDAGVDHLGLGMIHEESVALDTAPSAAASKATLRSIERFGTELLPALKERVAT
jgi:alkanesulfonate monooxygenase SsuD/methylene tetrahydromethanopterin reductase-like flavin-dependent oxidoreductase (luciferase family)